MLRPRIIPTLLLKGKGLVKGVKFKDHTYVGDPINAVQIFNAKEVDELLFLDITATAENRTLAPEMIQRIADQCLMPFGVGGGIRTIQQVRDILSAGAEKVCVSTGALENPDFVRQVADVFGSQSIVVSVDYRAGSWLDKGGVYSRNGTRKVGNDLIATCRLMEQKGAGELLLNAIARDGTHEGYDLETLKKVSEVISIPLIASGGAGNYGHLRQALKEGHADAVAAGSLFVHHGKRRAVLISYPSDAEQDEIVK